MTGIQKVLYIGSMNNRLTEFMLCVQWKEMDEFETFQIKVDYSIIIFF